MTEVTVTVTLKLNSNILMNQPNSGGDSTVWRLCPHIPAAVVFWRQLRGMRQEDLARESGLCLSEVKWLERGRKNAPRMDSLERASTGLRISLMELLATAQRKAQELGC